MISEMLTGSVVLAAVPLIARLAHAHFEAALLAGYAFGLAVAAASLGEMVHCRSRLRDQQRRDSLTGLANRFEFDRLLCDAVERGERLSGRVAVISIDLDGFKQVNDIRGRRVGDAVLAAIAADLAGALARKTASCALARIGGDQFAILMLDCEDRGAPAAVAELVLEAVRESAALQSPGIPITASVGASLFPEHSTDGPTLTRMADIAMYQSKSRNGDCYTFFDACVNGVDFGNSAMVGVLRNALEHNRLRLLYQPIVGASGEAVLFEALVRIDDPENGWLSPTQFIPVAEQTGFIREIGRVVVREACRQARAWRDSGFPVRVAVNVSAVELQTPSFAKETTRIAASEGVRPEEICIEITETAIMRDPKTAEENLLNLRAAGFSIAMDDFGTGYSSLSMLHRLPLDHLKIDRSFSYVIAADSRMRTVVDKTVQLAHELGMRVIAEGIEQGEQLEAARAIGCDYFQGFLFATPLMPHLATELLEQIGARSDLLGLENALRQRKFQGIDARARDARDLEKIEIPL